MSDNEDYFSNEDDESIMSDTDDENDEIDTQQNTKKNGGLGVNKKFVISEEDDDDNNQDDDDDVVNEYMINDDDDVDEDDDDDDMDDYDYEQTGGAKELEKSIKTNKKQQEKVDVKKNISEKDDEEMEDDEDEEEDDDEYYLQKFDAELNKNYITETHPESVFHNMEEIKEMTKVFRDSNFNIIDQFHRTLPFLTKYEKTRVIGQRAKQLESGAKPFIEVPENVIDTYLIAELELKQKKIPFIIKRPLHNGGSEYWSLKDLEIINF